MMAADTRQKKKDQDESQQHLSKWGEEEWQTKDGSANAKQEDGTQKRYLPKKAWERATDEKKQRESKEGKLFVARKAGRRRTGMGMKSTRRRRM